MSTFPIRVTAGALLCTVLALLTAPAAVVALPGGGGGGGGGWFTFTTTTATPTTYSTNTDDSDDSEEEYNRRVKIILIVVPSCVGVLLIALTLILLLLCRHYGLCGCKERVDYRRYNNNPENDPTVYDSAYYERNGTNYPAAEAYTEEQEAQARAAPTGSHTVRRGFVIHMNAADLASGGNILYGDVSHSPTNEQSVTDHYLYTTNPLNSDYLYQQQEEEQKQTKKKKTQEGEEGEEMGSTSNGSTHSGDTHSETEMVVFPTPASPQELPSPTPNVHLEHPGTEDHTTTTNNNNNNNSNNSEAMAMNDVDDNGNRHAAGSEDETNA